MGMLSVLRPFASCNEEHQCIAMCLCPWGGACTVFAERAFEEPLYCFPKDYDAWFTVLPFCCFAVRPVLRCIGCVSGYRRRCYLIEIELEACVSREVRCGVREPTYPCQYHEEGTRWSCHLLPRPASCRELV